MQPNCYNIVLILAHFFSWNQLPLANHATDMKGVVQLQRNINQNRFLWDRTRFQRQTFALQCLLFTFYIIYISNFSYCLREYFKHILFTSNWDRTVDSIHSLMESPLMFVRERNLTLNFVRVQFSCKNENSPCKKVPFELEI